MDFKPKGSVSFYPPSPNLHPSDCPLRLSTSSCIPSEPSCSRVSLASVAPTASYGGSFHNFSPSDADPLLVDIVLPPGLVLALLKAISPNDSITGPRLVVADTGTMDHMVPDRSAFISYKAVHNLCVRMGNNSYTPILGRGTAIILLSGQCLLMRTVLHVPGASCSSLQSLCPYLSPGLWFFRQLQNRHAHLLPGCGSECGHVDRLSSVLRASW